MKTTQSKIILAVILVCIIAGVGYAFFGADSGTTITAETTTVTKGKVATMVTATGTIEPLTEVEVGTQVSGEVEKIYVDYNSTVTKGQLLAELDKTNLIAALQQANASYSNAVTQRDYYNKIYSRQKKLYEEEVISQADFDDAEYNFNNSKISVTQALSDLQKAKTNLSYADIYSPIDGVVLSKEVDEGQTVAASFETPTLFTIAKDLKEMQVEADVDEADIGNVAEGQRVSFTVDAYQGETFTGTITQVRLDPTEEESVITYTVVIKADNPDLKLKPGLTATVSIYTLELDDVLTTEAKAVNFNPA
ncbi:MAG: efflux RND transporter periplasmic adaptor subunit, partial [Bacteroidota bacterium]|nr:efflux RND transporter periplasmic adaptor subunit [Bacteroidota bacterium]